MISNGIIQVDHTISELSTNDSESLVIANLSVVGEFELSGEIHIKNPYVKYLLEVIDLILIRKDKLFDVTELKLLESYSNLSNPAAQCLFARMTLRKGPWMRSDRLQRCIPVQLGVGAEFLHQTLIELSQAGLIELLRDQNSLPNAMDAMTCCLSVEELKALLRRVSQTSVQSDRSGLLHRVMQAAITTRNIFGKPLDMARLLHESLKSVFPFPSGGKQPSPLIVRIHPSVLTLIRRMERLVQISSGNSTFRRSSSWTVRKPLLFNAAVLVILNKIRYPVYEVRDITGSSSLFPCRRSFLQWEAAVELRCVFDELTGDETLSYSSSLPLFLHDVRTKLLRHILHLIPVFDDNDDDQGGGGSSSQRTSDGPSLDISAPQPSRLASALLEPVLRREGGNGYSNKGGRMVSEEGVETETGVVEVRLCLVAAICLTSIMRQRRRFNGGKGSGNENETEEALDDDSRDSNDSNDLNRSNLEDQIDCGTVLGSIVTHGVTALELHRDQFSYELSVQLLRLLLRSVYSARRRQAWRDRLCIDLRHLDRLEEAVEEVNKGRKEAQLLGQYHQMQTLDRRLAFLTARIDGKGERRRSGAATCKQSQHHQQERLATLESMIESVIRGVARGDSCANEVDEDEEVQILWSCGACTLLNDKHANKCVMCDTPRQMMSETIVSNDSKVKDFPVSVPTTTTTTTTLKSIKRGLRSEYDDDDNDEGKCDEDMTNYVPNSVADVTMRSVWSLLELPTEAIGVAWRPPVVAVCARRLGRGRPGKSRFIGGKDDVVSVEGVVMEAMFTGEVFEEEEEEKNDEQKQQQQFQQHCDDKNADVPTNHFRNMERMWRDGGWKGWHCEGSPLRSLFGLLMWDVLFMTVTGNDMVRCTTFITPYQDAPLDLGQPGGSFYRNRKDAIDNKLSWLSTACVQNLLDAVGSSYRTHFRQKCCAVRWSHPMATLQAIAVCLGGKALATVFRMLAVDYSYFSGGAPDLLMVRASRKKKSQSNGTPSQSREYLDLGVWLGEGWEGLGRQNRDAMDYDDILGARTLSDSPSSKPNGDSRLFLPFDSSEPLVTEENNVDDDNDDATQEAVVSSPKQRLDPFLCNATDLTLHDDGMIIQGTSSSSSSSPFSSDWEYEYEAMLVEVKGPTDSLSPKQLLWLQTLCHHGVNALVCSIHEPSVSVNSKSNKMSGRKRPKGTPYVRLQN
eukprot:gene6579-13309_t